MNTIIRAFLITVCLLLTNQNSFSQIRCDLDPKEALRVFIREFESAQRERRLQDVYNRWIIRSTFDEFMRTVNEMNKNFGSPRMGDEPRLVEWRPITARNFVGIFVAFYSRGQVEQQVFIECENNFWKVVGLKVSPPRR